MAQSITEIAQSLIDANKKVQLIYAFNGTGKTRLSSEFKNLIAPKNQEEQEEVGVAKIKIMYYNAFTEDLFYWDNDLLNDEDRKLKIQPNSYTNWVLVEQGQEPNITTHFQRYTSDKLTPSFNEDFSEVRFSFERGNEEPSEFVKISKGEESCFIWSVFYSFLEQAINVLNVAEEADRETDRFNDLKYVFIDDPVSSLDDTHLIELAVNIAELIKSSQSDLEFIITTHNPLFYNVLFNEFSRVKKTKEWRLEKLIDGTFNLEEQIKDSPFSYHLFLLSELEKALQSKDIQKFHFNFIRNIFEKTSTFLGFNNWEQLLPQDSREAYHKRIINLSSHSKHHGEEISILDDNDKRMLSFLVREIIIKIYNFKSNNNQLVTEEDVTV
jgi:wobble nucleotide-excising tRNase